MPMRYLFIFFILATSFSGVAQSDRSQNWQLVWEDNFDFLDTDIWLVKNNFDHWGGEPQVYTSRPENVFIQDGHLVLRVMREEYSCPPEYISQWHCVKQYNTGEPYEYTSGWIETQQPDYNTQYGLIEARIMLPYGRGFWPAFWTFKADNAGATNAAEIDIFEMLGSKPPNKITTNIHLEYCNEAQPDYPVCASIPSYYQENLIANYAYSYHTYAIEWTPTHLRWWIDDYMFRSEVNPGVEGPVRTIINMALEPWSPPDESTPFPSDVLIDFVRVYSLVTGVFDDQITDADLSLYPNPVRSEEVVRLNAGAASLLDLEVINSLGQVVRTFNSVNAVNYDLDVSGLTDGIYIVNVRTDKGSAVKTLFVY